HGDRVRHPLRRRPDGAFEEIDWTTAIAEIATRLNEIRRRHSSRAIALVGIGGQGNHMDAPYAMAFLRGTGSRRWFNALAQETARTATRHLRVKPGTDVYLLLAMAAVIVREGLAAEAFVAGHTIGLEQLRAELAAVDVARMAARCGLAVDDIVETARGFARAE